MKQRKDHGDDAGVVLNEYTEDEGYKWYKKLCYRNLILEALLAFLLGGLLCALLKLG